MQRPSYIPEDYTPIKVVSRVEDVVGQKFSAPVNCIIFPRILGADFNAIAAHYMQKPNALMIYRAPEMEEAFKAASGNLKAAAMQIIADLTDSGGDAHLKILKRNSKDEINGRYHVDSGLEAAHGPQPFIHRAPPLEEWGVMPRLLLTADRAIGRILCNYTEPVTQYLRNDFIESVSVEQRTIIMMDEELTRPAYFYTPKPNTPPLSFRAGDIWRQATY
jgi:hypothetical protein